MTFDCTLFDFSDFSMLTQLPPEGCSAPFLGYYTQTVDVQRSKNREKNTSRTYEC